MANTKTLSAWALSLGILSLIGVVVLGILGNVLWTETKAVQAENEQLSQELVDLHSSTEVAFTEQRILVKTVKPGYYTGAGQSVKNSTPDAIQGTAEASFFSDGTLHSGGVWYIVYEPKAKHVTTSCESGYMVKDGCKLDGQNQVTVNITKGDGKKVTPAGTQTMTLERNEASKSVPLRDFNFHGVTPVISIYNK